MAPTARFHFDERFCRVVLPIYDLVNPLNGSHGHWSKNAGRRRQHRQTAAFWLSRYGKQLEGVVAVSEVWIARVSPRKFDDDGLAVAMKAACKSVRDACAEVLQVTDADWRPGAVQWDYLQLKGEPSEYGVVVLVIGEGSPLLEEHGRTDGNPRIKEWVFGPERIELRLPKAAGGLLLGRKDE